MPIYDLSYRHWDGPRTASTFRWLPIATAGLMHFLKKRLMRQNPDKGYCWRRGVETGEILWLNCNQATRARYDWDSDSYIWTTEDFIILYPVHDRSCSDDQTPEHEEPEVLDFSYEDGIVDEVRLGTLEHHAEERDVRLVLKPFDMPL